MKKKVVLTGIGIFFVLLLAGYVAGAVYYGSHYFPGTVAGDIECGKETPEYVENVLKQRAGDYLLTVFDRNGGKDHIYGSQIGYAYNEQGEEERILEEQNPLLWPAHIMGLNARVCEMKVENIFDSDQLKEAVESLSFLQAENMVSPNDAAIELTEDGYEIIPEEEGSTLIFSETYMDIRSAVSSGETSLSLSDDDYQKPSVYSDDPSITTLADNLDRYLNATIHYEIGDADENFDRAEIMKVLEIGDDNTVTVNEDKVTAYVQQLCYQYNTYGDLRTFTTSMGDTIKVGGGDYGWVVSKTGEKAQILADLEAGEPVDREPVYEQTALYPGPDDIGNTYVEVDYTSQHLWYYKDGKLALDCDVVTGCLATSNGSVDGVYEIKYKQKDATLVGENYSSDVSWFMPFAYNIGFHDASWRSAFGGTIYKTAGSHGCVNMPVDKAEELYEMVEVGTPVVAYYREEVKLTNNAARMSGAWSYVEEEDSDGTGQ